MNRIFFAVSATPRPEALSRDTHPSPLGDTGKHQATMLRKKIHRRLEDPYMLCSPVTHVRETARRIAGTNYIPITELQWKDKWSPRAASLAIYVRWLNHRKNLVVCMPFGFVEDILRALFPQADFSRTTTQPGDALEIEFIDCNSPNLSVTHF